ncbi:MAG: Alpha-galactosidase [Verrucomicrobiota bacterium]|jgi:alpha-galactosidase
MQKVHVIRFRPFSRARQWLAGTGAYLTMSAGSASAAEDPAAKAIEFQVAARSFGITYSLDKDGALLSELRDFEQKDADRPVKGQVFPSRFIRTLNRYCHGPRYTGPLAVSLPNGDTSLQLIYDSHNLVRESADIEHTTIVVRDRDHPVFIELHIRSYQKDNILEQWMVLRNETGGSVSVARLDSFYFQSENREGTYLEWYDSTQNSEAGKPEREKLLKGCKLLESRHGNRHVSGPEPFFNLGFGAPLAEESGLCLIAALAWSGSTRLAFEIDDRDTLEVSCGVGRPLPVIVEPGGRLETPACVFTFSARGKGPASRDFHQWMRRHGMRDGDRLRPVDNNSWEGCGMKISEQAVLEMMKSSAKLGIELYVLDDGWFGNGPTARVNDRTGLGDWQINRERFPNGFAPLIEAGRNHQIDFGLWFEPEMINPASELFAAHPEWVMRVPGRELDLQRGQAVLDLSNPEVQEHVFNSVHNLLAQNPGIRFVKWDANSSINNPYSPYLGPARQGELHDRHLAAYHAIQAKLVKAHPHVDFQTCSAGGGRADLGAMKNSHTFWPSDNTNPSHRLGSIWNFSTVMPAMAMTSHVTHAGEGFATKYRFDVSMMTQLGMEVDPRAISQDYLAASKLGIESYKMIREIVQNGDQYRHQNPFDSTTPSLNFVSPDRSQAVILAYQTGGVTSPLTVASPLAGIDPDRTYVATELNLPSGDSEPRLSEGHARKGSEWMERGVPLVFKRQFDSAVVKLVAVDGGESRRRADDSNH